jgi:hypothetical protein
MKNYGMYDVVYNWGGSLKGRSEERAQAKCAAQYLYDLNTKEGG